MTSQPLAHGLTDAVLEELANGFTLIEICSRPGMPSRGVVYRLIDDDEDFARAYEVALQRGGDAIADLAHVLAATTTRDNATAHKVVLDALKWRAARLNPRYGVPASADAAADDASAPLDMAARRAELFERLDAIEERMLATPAGAISSALHAAGPLDFERDRERILWICETALGPPIGQNGNAVKLDVPVENATAAAE
jgi:hypothetical protein